MGLRKLPGGVSLFFRAVFVRIVADDVDDVADGLLAGCIYENTPIIEHATARLTPTGSPQTERWLKIGGVYLASSWINKFEGEFADKISNRLAKRIKKAL